MALKSAFRGARAQRAYLEKDMRLQASVLLAVVTMHLAAESVRAQYRPDFIERDEHGRIVASGDERGRLRRYVYAADGSREVWVGQTLSAVEKPDGRVIAYAYDEQGKKIQTRITQPGRKPRFIDHSSAAPAVPSRVARPGRVQNGKQAAGAGASKDLVPAADERGAVLLRSIRGEDSPPRAAAAAPTQPRPTSYQPIISSPTTIAAVTAFGQAGASPSAPSLPTYPSFGPGAVPIGRAVVHEEAHIPAEVAEVKNYTWDENGNLTASDDGTRYTWDTENRLIRVARADGTTIDHVYDFDGNRVETKVVRPGQPVDTTKFLVDTSGPLPQVVAETDGAGQLKAHYTRGADGELLSVMRPDGSGGFTTKYVHSDHIGSVRRLTDESGAVTDGFSYTAFGELLGRTGTDPLPYAFAGEPLDSHTGLQYHRARWLSSASGRFASADTYPVSLEVPLTLHRYAYAAANPVNQIDPSGLFFSASTSFASFGVQTTIAAMSVPAFSAATLKPNNIDLVPILLKNERWPGWPHNDVHVQLTTAKHYWEQALGPGNRVNIRTEIGPEDGRVAINGRPPAFGQDLDGILRRHYQPTFPLNTVPIVFLRAIGGRDLYGATTTNNPRELAAIAMRPAFFGAPPDRVLAHELGHVFGLSDHMFLPWRLMNSPSFGDI